MTLRERRPNRLVIAVALWLILGLAIYLLVPLNTTAAPQPDPECWWDGPTLHAVNLPDEWSLTAELYPTGVTSQPPTFDGTFAEPFTAYFWQRGGGKSLVKAGAGLNDYHVICIAAPIVLTASTPFSVYQTIETARTEPWLDPTCYDDDHTLELHAYGWLDAGETFRYQTPLDVCSSKIVRGLVTAAKRDDAALTVTDWYGDIHPGRAMALPKGREGWAACNTDSKSDVQVRLEDEIRAPVAWELTALSSGTYRFEAILNEPWWQGQESDYGYCGHTP